MEEFKHISPLLSVAGQLAPSDMARAKAAGFGAIVINRPDGEAGGQPSHTDIAAAAEAEGLKVHYIPIEPGKITEADIAAFDDILNSAPPPVLAYCRTGTRSTTLWALTEAGKSSTAAILNAAKKAGYDLTNLRDRLEDRRLQTHKAPSGGGHSMKHQIVIVGGGSAGIATAASLLKRRKALDIAIVEPRAEHYYQPGWTMVGGGIFDRKQTVRPTSSVMPKGVKWIQAAASGFEPEQNAVLLEDGTRLEYDMLVAVPGLKLDWDGIQGLSDTLGRNGVTSNYSYDHAPYTWQLVEQMKEGKALFTQPPMPIKCAGAPQKAMYLASDAWRRSGDLKNIDVSFHNAGGVLFGVSEYVPPLMKYVERYGIDLCFKETLVAVYGDTKTAVFDVVGEDDQKTRVTRSFDMLHVTPPQTPLDFVRDSDISSETGWIDVDQETLQHMRFPNVFSLGDSGSTPNAKTAAAVRKQVPIAAVNILRVLDGEVPHAVYNGYGSCPLTVERGKIVLAEFGYGGKLLPTLPKWVVNGSKATKAAWFLKSNMLPGIYFNQMLRGTEWLVAPEIDKTRSKRAA
tara:strand:+ start:9552 stop:11258 length:1707 start_codon:yes stop_codon:yes gene_type:complete